MTADPKTTSAAQHFYCIRIAEKPGTPCAICEQSTGVGPVGYQHDDPVCDRCLLDGVPAFTAVSSPGLAVEHAFLALGP